MSLNSYPNTVSVLPEHPLNEEPILDTIIEEPSGDHYRVCWKANEVGVITKSPCLFGKDELAKTHPQVIDAWELKQRHEKEEASRLEGKFVTFIGKFLDRKSNTTFTNQLSHGVACDQILLPGMVRHWGPVRNCVSHPKTRPAVGICKGCRVSHYGQDSEKFDRPLIMARGARVAVCEGCATKAFEIDGDDGCVCDKYWTCHHCREAELAVLAKARDKHVKGICGSCTETGNLVQHLDICLHCRKWRVYAMSQE
jgi:hypothetical protein